MNRTALSISIGLVTTAALGIWMQNAAAADGLNRSIIEACLAVARLLIDGVRLILPGIAPVPGITDPAAFQPTPFGLDMVLVLAGVFCVVGAWRRQSRSATLVYGLIAIAAVLTLVTIAGALFQASVSSAGVLTAIGLSATLVTLLRERGIDVSGEKAATIALSPGGSGELFDSCADGILKIDLNQTILDINPAAEALFGRSRAELIGNSLRQAVALPNDDLFAARDLQSRLSVTGWRPNGDPFPIEVTLSPIPGSGTKRTYVMVRDISELCQRQEQLERLALHDSLTGLPNRVLMQDRLDQAVRLSERSGNPFALMLLDLNRFKRVNDTLGHHIGDLLLQKLGPRLKQPLRDTDTLARLGGDEFAVLLPGPTDLETACGVAERIVESVAQPFMVEELNLDIGVSIGVALFPEHGNDSGELLNNADAAMYVAKRGQLGFAVYDATDDRRSVRRLTLRGDLRRAIENDEFVIRYQPKVDAKSAMLCGVEALVRWQHSEHGLMGPDEFITIAEQTGLVRALTIWVLSNALKQQQIWRQAGIDIPISVNLSLKSLQDEDFPDRLRLLLNTWDGRPEQLLFEVTESTLMADPDRSIAVLDRLAAIGCHIGLDDFGTGISSLKILQRLPIKEIKVDRSFVSAMADDEAAAVVVRSIVRLAHSLGLRTVAEGVESRQIFDWLGTLGCDQVQGYMFGKPMDAPKLEQWLTETPWGQHLRDDGRPEL
ncbi:MAG: putative bifunctional diguanylate cyclase/phosphodiesterase [Geminicoccaceae bacterium]